MLKFMALTSTRGGGGGGERTGAQASWRRWAASPRSLRRLGQEGAGWRWAPGPAHPHGKPEAGRSWGGPAGPCSSSAPAPVPLVVPLARQPPAAVPEALHAPSGPQGHSSRGPCGRPATPGTGPAPPGKPRVGWRLRLGPGQLPPQDLAVLEVGFSSALPALPPAFCQPQAQGGSLFSNPHAAWPGMASSG